MKRFFLAFCLTGILVQSPLSAQKIEDVIYLKNGETVRGTIIEQIPGESLKIQTPDGSVFVYTIYQIAEISREPVMKVEEGFIKAKKKNPWLGSGLSCLIPGTGQFYNDQYNKGLPQFGVAVAGAGLMWWGVRDNYESYEDNKENSSWNPLDWVDEDRDDKLIYFGTPLWLASLLWSVVDANLSANRINQEGQKPDYGHLFEIDGDRATLGLDSFMQRNGQGVRLMLHF